MNDTRRVVAALLTSPALAEHVSNLEQLAQLRRPGIPLLLELIDMIRNGENMTTARLVEAFHDRPEYAALDKLATHEFPESDSEPELLKQIFVDAWAQLLKKVREQRYDDLLRKPHNELTEEEKAEIRAFGRQ